MVLTNFECWAHGGGAGGVGGGAAGMELPFGTAAPMRHVDLFNPRAVQQAFGLAAAGPPSGVAQHVSSDCYYGFSYVNAAHELNNNNNTNAQNQNGGQNNNNNNNNGCMPNANDVNGTTMMHDALAEGNVLKEHAGAGAAGGGFAARCKKRYFVSDDDYANCDIGAGVDIGVARADVAAKRCRFDDDYVAAQYCNDFFSLPSTQIGTQSCLMDTEDYSQSQQDQHQHPHPQAQQPHAQQVDVAMGGPIAQPNFNQQSTTTTSNIHFASQLQQQAQQQQQLQHQPQSAHAQTISTTAPTAYGNGAVPQLPPAAYQQQHNYQAARSCQHAFNQSATFGLSISSKCWLHMYNNSNNNVNEHNHSNHNKQKIMSNLGDTANAKVDVQIRQSKPLIVDCVTAVAVDEDDIAATLFSATHGGSVYQFGGNPTVDI